MSDTPTPNTPDLWLASFPRPGTDDHKYHRGHAVIFAAPELTGATRLSAEAAARIGAGLVSVLAAEREDVYRAALMPDIMVKNARLAEIRKQTAVLIGPGGVHPSALDDVTSGEALDMLVVDADAIAEARALRPHARQMILTPHEGEMSRSFPDLAGSREDRALAAAKALSAIVVLKGARTLIASPDGGLIANTHASPWLAKAGTGDVLAGFITGLAAQGMAPALACACAVWIHGDAARRIGPGLLASDLPGRVPDVLRGLKIS